MNVVDKGIVVRRRTTKSMTRERKELGDDFVVVDTASLRADSGEVTVDRGFMAAHSFCDPFGLEPLRQEHDGLRFTPAQVEACSEAPHDWSCVTAADGSHNSQEYSRAYRLGDGHRAVLESAGFEVDQKSAGDDYCWLAKTCFDLRQQHLPATIRQMKFKNNDIHFI